MSDKTYKNIFDDGYTTYHDDGSVSKTYKNIFGDGYTTYFEDGSKAKTYKHIFDDGYTTYNSDGSSSKTFKNIFNDGYTTYHENGDTSKTYKNIFSEGYTTYNSKGTTYDPYGSFDINGSNASYGESSSPVFNPVLGETASKNFSFVEKTDYFTFGFFALLAAIGGCFYSDCSSLIPFILYIIAFEVCLVANKKWYLSPGVWGELYFTAGTVAIMWTVNNCGDGKGFFFFIPILSAIVIFFIGASFFEDHICSGPFYIIMIAISWFCCLYKGMKAYYYLLIIQAVIMIVYFAIVFIAGVLDGKAYRKKY